MRSSAKLVTSILLCLLLVLAPASFAGPFASSDFTAIPLGAPGHDAVYDSGRNLLYVTVPSRNELVVVSPATRTVVDRFFVGSSPRGLDLSQDGNSLYIALNQAAAVAKVNLPTKAVSEIVVGTQLDSSLVWDVAEARPGIVFATGSPGSGGFAYVVRIDTTNNNSVTRVASNRIIRAGPVFLESPDATRLYVGEGFSPNSLYALDLTQPAAPIVLEDNHGTVGGTQAMDISPDGKRIYLSSGQVLRSDSFLQAGLIGFGLPRVTADGLSAFVLNNNQVDIYSTANFLKTGDFFLPQGSVSTYDLFANDTGMYALSGSTLLLAQVPEPAALALLFSAPALLLPRRRATPCRAAGSNGL